MPVSPIPHFGYVVADPSRNLVRLRKDDNPVIYWQAPVDVAAGQESRSQQIPAGQLPEWMQPFTTNTKAFTNFRLREAVVSMGVLAEVLLSARQNPTLQEAISTPDGEAFLTRLRNNQVRLSV